MKYWLFKSEPDEYSIDDLAAEADGIGCWNGIRNYQARNLLRDQVNRGDAVLFYHSSCKVPGVAGIAKVVGNAYPDPSQLDPESQYFDPKSTQHQPRWYCVDIQFSQKFSQVLSLKQLKQQSPLENMVLLKQGRLSIQPVTTEEWQFILSLAGQ